VLPLRGKDARDLFIAQTIPSKDGTDSKDGKEGKDGKDGKGTFLSTNSPFQGVGGSQ
jgi:hypothetical protein